jgi:hypothetical protein
MNSRTAAPTHIIRLAMLAGVLTFGGVVYYLRRNGDAPGVDAEQARAFLWIGRALWGMAILGCLILYQLVLRERSPARRQSFQIVAWALGEMVALYGAMIWFLTGSPSWYTPGLIYLALAFLAFPIRRD